MEDAGAGWALRACAPSYACFEALSRGTPVDWGRRRIPGGAPDVDALLEATRRLAGRAPDLVAVDMPLAHSPIAGRRAADRAVSRRFGARGCSTHSPSAVRPGALGDALRARFAERGFALATAAPARAPCLIEVYPHVALLTLVGAGRRLPYKVSRSLRYWPGASVAERAARLRGQWLRIAAALGEALGGVAPPLPPETPATLASWKRYEDAMDGAVCAWMGARALDGRAEALGDGDAAIWVPA